MGADELAQHVLGGITVDPQRWQETVRAAAVHAADRIGTEHPHPLDEEMPQLAGQLIARDPAVRQQLHDLIDALGLHAELAVATDTNQHLKEGQ